MAGNIRTVPASEYQTIIQEANKINKVFQEHVLFEISLYEAEGYAFDVARRGVLRQEGCRDVDLSFLVGSGSDFVKLDSKCHIKEVDRL